MRFLTKDGSAWELPASQLQRFAEVYPDVPIEQECQKAALWLEANPAKRKTSRGMLRFLVNWLNRAGSGWGRTTESPFSREELAEAKRIRRLKGGYCDHQPPCETWQQCEVTTMRRIRLMRGV